MLAGDRDYSSAGLEGKCVMFVLVLLFIGAAGMLTAYIVQVLKVAQSARSLDLHPTSVSAAQTHAEARAWMQIQPVLWATKDR